MAPQFGSITGTSQQSEHLTVDRYISVVKSSRVATVIINNFQTIYSTDSRLSDARTPKSHAHGNITNDGTITSTAVTSATGVLVYDSSNKIQRATAAQTRSIIGAGTSNLTIGTTSTTAASGNHTHNQYAEVVSFSGGDLILKINN